MISSLLRCAALPAVALLIILSCSVDPAQAQSPSGNLGVGGQLGDPSGFTLKLYPREGFAYEFLAAWDLNDFFFLNAHALHERAIPETPLRYYLGPGAVLGFRNDGNGGTEAVLGISGQAGVNFFVEQFEVFLHLTPRLGVIPDTDGHVGGGIGLRYYP